MNRASGLMSPRGQAVMWAALALLVFTAFPFAWMAATALKPSREIFVTPPTLWPAHVTLDNPFRATDAITSVARIGGHDRGGRGCAETVLGVRDGRHAREERSARAHPQPRMRRPDAAR